MSSNFYNCIQPSIIKCSNAESIPEHLRGKFMININAMSIRWFVNNFKLIEDEENGAYMYTLDADVENVSDTLLDIPRAYVVLSDEFISDQRNFRDWIIASFADTDSI